MLFPFPAATVALKLPAKKGAMFTLENDNKEYGLKTVSSL